MDTEFHKRLLATFTIETKEHLAAISAGLLALEKAADDGKRREIIEKAFREAHSLKGAARAVNLARIESLSHGIENAFAEFKKKPGPISPFLFDLLHRTLDAIDKSLTVAVAGRDDSADSDVTDLLLGLQAALKRPDVQAQRPEPVQAEKKDEPARDPTPAEKPVTTDTVRISMEKLDSVLSQAEEMLSAKLAALHRAADLERISSDLAEWEKELKKVEPIVRRMRKLHNSPLPGLSKSDTAQLEKLIQLVEGSGALVKSLLAQTSKLARTFKNHRHSLDGMVDALVEDLKDVLMLPCATTLEGLPRMVRDLARSGGKEAEVFFSGDNIRIDKRVLDELKDPLTHLVRNCIDHGIEAPEQRRRLKKSPCGKVSVAVSLLDSGRVEITVSDDGAGIEFGRVAEAAVRTGAAGAEEARRMDTEELTRLLFKSGFSTSAMITDISGRGLGLAIVREKVEKLGGTVTVTSEPGKGASFRLVLPLTLSTCRGILVTAGDQTFVVPAAGVERVLRVARNSIKTVENRPAVEVHGKAVSFVPLAEVLQLRRKEEMRNNPFLSIFIVRSGASRISFEVDSVLGEQEVLVKGLGPQLSRVKNIAGVTILGTGAVVPILHPGDLVKSAIAGAGISAPAVSTVREKPEPEKSVLVVEDSVTSRTLLRNILETAGYRTTTAVDGMDALMQLKTDPPDLVVSDVDMPRMSGLDLTAKIRGMTELADLPVVLVTSLDSREDRERGIDVGANAYIVKSSFDHSNLLEVIRRLI